MSYTPDYQCTWWPDVWFGISITDCCIAHDLGGSDTGLFLCVAGKGGWEFTVLAFVMIAGLALFRPFYRFCKSHAPNGAFFTPKGKMMEVSFAGRKFIAAHEGNPLTAYLDPVGVPTIGIGFTMRSAAVRRELAKIGITKLVPGKTKITPEQSDRIFEAALNEEFGPSVAAKLPKRKVQQHQFDACVSASYNLGLKFMGWRWMKAWKAGDIVMAASIWANNYNTAGGRKLRGLVRRRKEEAKLFEHGFYEFEGEGTQRKEGAQKPFTPDPVVEEAQEHLTRLGIDPGKIDGWMGRKTKEAVIAYQKNHPHLVNDGIIGPATMAQLRRDVIALRDGAEKTGALSVLGGLASFFYGLPWGLIVAGLIAAGVIYFAYRYRDVIQRRWNKLAGKVVSV